MSERYKKPLAPQILTKTTYYLDWLSPDINTQLGTLENNFTNIRLFATSANPGQYPNKRVGTIDIEESYDNINKSSKVKPSYLGTESTTMKSVFSPQGQLFYVKGYQDDDRTQRSQFCIGWIIGENREGRNYYKFVTEMNNEDSSDFGSLKVVKEWQIDKGCVGFSSGKLYLIKFFWTYDGKKGDIKICNVNGRGFNSDNTWDEEYYEKDCKTYFHPDMVLDDSEYVENVLVNWG